MARTLREELFFVAATLMDESQKKTHEKKSGGDFFRLI